MDQEYQDAGSEYEQRSGEDLQELSEEADRKEAAQKEDQEFLDIFNDRARRNREFVKNCYNDFMVLYFSQGYSYIEASKKARAVVDEILEDSEGLRNDL